MGFRSGSVSPAVVESVRVVVDGGEVPVGLLAFSQPSPRGVLVTPFDQGHLHFIIKALVGSGFSAYAYSKREALVSVPPPSGEERARILAHVARLGEGARVSIRNVRKKLRGTVDDKTLQRLTDAAVAEVAEIIHHVEARL